MGDYDREQHVIIAAQHMVKELRSSVNLNDEFKKLLSDFDVHLSTMIIHPQRETQKFTEIKERLTCAEETIMRAASNQVMIWSSFLQVIDEIRMLIEILSSQTGNSKKKLTQQAFVALQIGMERLEEELVFILHNKKQSFGFAHVVGHASEVVEKICIEDGDDKTYDCIIDLIDSDMIPDLKSIASSMFASNYSHEFCESFITVRKQELNEYLNILKIEEIEIEDVMKLEPNSLIEKIKIWIRATKIIIRAYLTSEKWLCKQILGNFGSADSICFVKISQHAIMQLVNFGHAVAITLKEPDQLFSLLNIYEVVEDLVVYIDTLFEEKNGSFIKTEFLELRKRLGDSARKTIRKFINAVELDKSKYPFPRGGIHPLTKYTMNYIRILTDYGDTLNSLLRNQNLEPENDQENLISNFFYAATSVLQSNLMSKSRLYKEESLQHIFLMNNIHYMVKKVRNSDLKTFLTNEWIKTHIAKFQQHSTSYVRETWSPILSLLRDDVDSSSSPLTKAIIKQRLRKFNQAFEDIYKTQIEWFVPDKELREDLQISISQKIIHAYWYFSTRNSKNIRDKYVKYTAEELEGYLLDLFEGTPRSLNPFRKI